MKAYFENTVRNGAAPPSELHFTPGNPRNVRVGGWLFILSTCESFSCHSAGIFLRIAAVLMLKKIVLVVTPLGVRCR
jgi:hypothetical protein